ncbi:hypothetical protein [Thermochromatium tepidum]|uniref:DUF4124 domain-containing protein n=1 Tax=Thermochromatium tepidum ATCC 43061 TaxID=316276 RepID=A0A6I6EBY9_THETI|nr:hypothetical protein [Thermochromatium tepidum]QGU32459.1 hypothetical protein E6P07_05340 [Thermochromatium tepidum ATCC 43061]
MRQPPRTTAQTRLLLALILAVPTTALAYNTRDAIRDCEARLRSDYGLIDLRDEQVVQLPGDKNYRVEGKTKIDGRKYPWTCEIQRRRVVEVQYEGRRPPSGGGSGGSGAPEVVPRRSGELEVRLPSGCTALYDREGTLITRSSNCNSSDRRRAEDAVDAYLLQQGRGQGGGRGNEDGYGRDGRDQSGDERSGRYEPRPDRGGPPPEIMMDRNGEAEAVFRNDCVVYYDRLGRRTEARPNCNDRQLDIADQAMRDYRRAQGL